MPDPPVRHWQRDPLTAVDAARRSWANTPDRSARTAPARAALESRFADEIDPDRTLPEAERHRRAGQAKSDYFRALARLSARRRRLGRQDESAGETDVA
jgi:hypothetical protein